MSFQTLDTLELPSTVAAGRGLLGGRHPKLPPLKPIGPEEEDDKGIKLEKITMSVYCGAQIVFIHEEHATEKVKLNNKRTNIYLPFFLGHPTATSPVVHRRCLLEL